MKCPVLESPNQFSSLDKRKPDFYGSIPHKNDNSWYTKMELITFSSVIWPSLLSSVGPLLMYCLSDL